jgi:hypothetical protein
LAQEATFVITNRNYKSMQEIQNNHDPLGYAPEYMAKTKKVKSRLAQNQQEKLAKQTAILIGIAFFIVIAFMFAVIPGIIRLTGLFIDTGLPSDSDDVVPPRPPTISSPVEATFSATIVVSGFSEADSEVVAVLNSSELDRTVADGDGFFEIDISLQEEENKLRFYAIDAAGNESDTSRTYSIVYDAVAPTIELESPQDGQQFELRKNQTITVKGTTEANAKVYLNDRLIFARSDGSFSTTHQLQEGDNQLTFRAVDEAGNEREQAITVSFRL